MLASSAAQMLNEIFHGFDYSILSFYHSLAESAGDILTPVMRIITLIGEKGLWLYILSFILILFKKTRRLGVCIFGAVCCGALITNIILKDTICRPRPIVSYIEDYRIWWESIGSPAEHGYSFPSGHVTAAAAGMMAICLRRGRKYLFAAIPYVTLMCISRNYLMAHYPSDVLIAAIIGVFSAVIAHIITTLIFRFLKTYKKNPLFRFILRFDIRQLFKKENKAGTRK